MLTILVFGAFFVAAASADAVPSDPIEAKYYQIAQGAPKPIMDKAMEEFKKLDVNGDKLLELNEITPLFVKASETHLGDEFGKKGLFRGEEEYLTAFLDAALQDYARNDDGKLNFWKFMTIFAFGNMELASVESVDEKGLGIQPKYF